MEGTVPRQQLLEILGQLNDPRIDRHKKYPLLEIVFLTISAVLSGFEDWDEIVDFGESKLEWLRRYLPYANGIPSHDTLNCVISLLDYRALSYCRQTSPNTCINIANISGANWCTYRH